MMYFGGKTHRTFDVTPHPVGKAVVVSNGGKEYNCKVVSSNKRNGIVEATCKGMKFLCDGQQKPGVLHGRKI